MKKGIIGLIVIILIGVGVYYFINRSSDTKNIDLNPITTDTGRNGQTGTIPSQDKSKTIIGKSVEGRDIIAYHFGTGTTTELLFVGGIHGGYSWNTALVAYELMDYLKTSNVIPSNVRVTVIPVLNPDGLNKVVGTTTRFAQTSVSSSQEVQISGRFNGSTVDLNRNFDCDWKSAGTWQSKTVSGGTAPFSEPESIAIRDYITLSTPTAVVVWYSAAGGVFTSSCHNGVLPETSVLTKVYADASGYPAFQDFDFYAITGDMTNWLAKIGIPAVSVLLTTHQDTEWSKNQAGVRALIEYYRK